MSLIFCECQCHCTLQVKIIFPFFLGNFNIFGMILEMSLPETLVASESLERNKSHDVNVRLVETFLKSIVFYRFLSGLITWHNLNPYILNQRFRLKELYMVEYSRNSKGSWFQMWLASVFLVLTNGFLVLTNGIVTCMIHEIITCMT